MTVDSGQWTVDSGQWTVDSGQWTVDTAPADASDATGHDINLQSAML